MMLYEDNVLSLAFFHVINFENSKFELSLKVTISDQILKPEMISAKEVMNSKLS
jgi:hypothetical protein